MKPKTIFIIVGVLVTAAIVFYGSLVVSRLGKFKLEITAAPHDSVLTMDGQPLNEGVIYIAKGTHKFTADREYFGRLEKTVNTAELDNGQKLFLMPLANSDEAISWLRQNPDVQQEREAAAGAEQEQSAARLLKRYPILAKLPQENLHYKIDYSISGEQKVKLLITTYGIINGPADYQNYLSQTKAYRIEALDFLNQNGVSPNTFGIEYTPKIE